MRASYTRTVTKFSRQSLTNYNYAASFNDSADDGFVLGGAFGLVFQGGWRAELEAAFRSYDFDGQQRLSETHRYSRQTYLRYSFVGQVTYFPPVPTSTTGPGPVPYITTATSGDPFVMTGTRSASPIQTAITATANSDGDLTSFSLMANVWYDFDLGPDNPLVPFIGAGLGMAKLDLDYRARATFPSFTGPSYTFPAATVTTRASADDWVFAWQLGAGLGYEFEGGMMLSAQYRYFATGDADIGGGQDIGVSAHEGLIGLSIPLGN